MKVLVSVELIVCLSVCYLSLMFTFFIGQRGNKQKQVKRKPKEKQKQKQIAPSAPQSLLEFTRAIIQQRYQQSQQSENRVR